MAAPRRARLLFAICIGVICSVALGGLLVGALALLSERLFIESVWVFSAVLAAFAVAGALYGFQAWRETPVDEREESDA